MFSLPLFGFYLPGFSIFFAETSFIRGFHSSFIHSSFIQPSFHFRLHSFFGLSDLRIVGTKCDASSPLLRGVYLWGFLQNTLGLAIFYDTFCPISHHPSRPNTGPDVG